MNLATPFRKRIVPLALILASGCAPSPGNSEIVNEPSESSIPAERSVVTAALEETVIEYQSLPTIDQMIAGGIEKAAQTLRETYHQEVIPEDLIYLSRLLFYEAGAEPVEGIKGVMEVILNRWKFDNQLFASKLTPNITGEKRFGDGTLMSVIKDNTLEFNAIGANPKDFQTKSFKDKKGEYKLSPNSDAQVQAKLEVCYQVVLEVLTGKASDPTEGALFYHNPNTSTSERLGAGKHMTTQVQEINEEGWRIRKEYHYRVIPGERIGKHLFYNAEAEARVTRWNDQQGITEFYLNGELMRECVRGKCNSY
ncbi:MAG TPA: cell wall hydrolase [Candidatus Nanoarchaeia archaeon]|nr:cell wall hydrolase [Candidatus Nanoarchaeia archaeon]